MEEERRKMLLARPITSSSARGKRPGAVKRVERKAAPPMVMMPRVVKVAATARGVEEEVLQEKEEHEHQAEPETEVENPVPIAARRERALQQMLEHEHEPVDLEALRKLAWAGLPRRWRPTVWLLLMGLLPLDPGRRQSALEKRIREYADFAALHGNELEEGHYTAEQKKSMEQIRLDLPRTHTKVGLFRHEVVQMMLRRVLQSYAIRHPASGYVQGMNDLLTPFLLVFLSEHIGEDVEVLEMDPAGLNEAQKMDVEAKCFWCLSKVVEGVQDNYTRDQPGIQRMLHQLKNLIQGIDPNLNAILQEKGLDYQMFAYRWINCFLMRELSLPLIVRMWDAYLADEQHQGFSHFHVYVCAAFLMEFSDQLKHLEMEEMIWFLQQEPAKHFDESHIASLLSHAFVFQSIFPLS